VLGPERHSHVICRDWAHEVILYRHDEELHCRAAARFFVDGRACERRSRITRNSRIEGEDFSLGLEPI